MVPVKLHVDEKIITETLERIGIVNKEKKEVTPTCYILKYNDKFYISHFKTLLRIQKPTHDKVPDSDIVRRNIILTMLENWGLIEIQQHGIYQYDLFKLIYVLRHSEKHKYTINHKINIPKMGRKINSGEISICLDI
jgi:hypothetical protein